MGLHVVIPVAGVGKRLRPHTHARPKVLVPVAGKPMLGHILEELRRFDVEEIALVVGYRGDLVREYATSHFDFKFRFVEQKEPKGLGHAIWVTADAYRDLSDQLLIVLGDTVFDADFDAILGGGNWLGVSEVEDPRRFGVVEMDGDRIKRLVEKPDVPPSNLAIVGIYAFEDGRMLYECLDDVVRGGVREQGEYQLTTALQGMLDKGVEIKTFKIRRWFDCGNAETLLATNRALLDGFHAAGKAQTPNYPGCLIVPPVAIDPTAKLANSIIGPHVTIGENATVSDSIVRDSIISSNAQISSALLEASIVSDDAHIQGRFQRLNIGDHSETTLG